MTYYIGLDVSQKSTAVCVVESAGAKIWREMCLTAPYQIEHAVRSHAGDSARIGVETGPMMPWLVHKLRGRGLSVDCLNVRYAHAVLKMQLNKNDNQQLLLAVALN